MSTILVVDDRQANRAVIASLLARLGHRMLEAGDGFEGLRLAGSERPDLIIVDILMPTMNGYEFVAHLRREPALERIPVIFYSAAFLEHEARAMAQSCGVADCLVRPAEPEVILRTVYRVLGLDASVSPPPPAGRNDQPVPLLLDALFEKRERFDEVSLRLAALVQAGLDLAAERDPSALVERFCHDARKIIGARFALAGVFQPDRAEPLHFHPSGIDALRAAALEHPAGRWASSELLRSGRPVRVTGVEAGRLTGDLPPEFGSVRSILSVPLQSSRRVYGWLFLLDKLGATEFTAEDERVALTLASMAAATYENSTLLGELRSQTDALKAEVVERMQAQAALRASEERYRMLFEHSPLPAWLVDAESLAFLAVNQAAVAHYGYSPEEFLGMTLHQILAPEEIGRLHEATAEMIEGAKHVAAWTHRKKDDSRIQVETTAHLIEWNERRAILALIADVTERRRLEQHLRQAHRMEAIGRLAGAVAHDFNNLLGVILGNAEMLEKQLAAGAPGNQRTAVIRDAAERGASLTRQLLAFSRQQVLEPKVLDLNAIFLDMEKLLQRLIGENIELVVRTEEGLGWVKADPGQIQQVLMNLAVNARDAMPDGGRLLIATRNVRWDVSYGEGETAIRPGPYVMFEVADTGCGMDGETQAHIFEPFFTAKQEGKGTGLGLATVYGVVKQSGGYIWVHSELGRGTTFKVYLPRVDEPVPRVGARGEPDRLLRGVETVLVVEDDEALRKITCEFLRGSGYSVIEAARPADALRLAESSPKPLDLLLTDVVLPEMNGRELARRLSAVRPLLKVLFVSGYSDETISRHGVLEPGLIFLQKPYTCATLTRKVREVIDAGDGVRSQGAGTVPPRQ
ncbi:MAG TPA: response regulator [Candidatus Acidoferrales bacterium]|nr:response regulator [Candidatus Acidoferrales bacterium]